MSTGPTDPGDRDFDRRLRELHAQSLARLSPAIRHRLKATPATRLQRPPVLATAGVAAVMLSLFALGWRMHPEAASPLSLSEHGTRVAAVEGPEAASDASLFATLDENPDLYLWLASSEGALLAQE